MAKDRRTHRERRKDEHRARSWRYDPQMEKALWMKRHDRDGFAKLPPVKKLELGHYIEGKRAARAAGIDTSKSGGDAA